MTWPFHHGVPSTKPTSPLAQGGEPPDSATFTPLHGRRLSRWLLERTQHRKPRVEPRVRAQTPVKPPRREDRLRGSERSKQTGRSKVPQDRPAALGTEPRDYKRTGHRTRRAEESSLATFITSPAPEAQLYSELVLRGKEPSRSSRPASAQQLGALLTEATRLPPRRALSGEPSGPRGRQGRALLPTPGSFPDSTLPQTRPHAGPLRNQEGADGLHGR